MGNLVDRRQFIISASIGGAAATLGSSGCGQAESINGGTTTSPGTDRIEPITLVFRDSDEFYKQLDDALKTSEEVIVTFNGSDRVGRDSRMLNKYLAESSNSQQIYEAFTGKDTAAGRDELKLAFEEEILEHQEAKPETRTPSGEVIEPGTVVLVLGILLIAAAASVAHAESARGRTYHVEIQAGPESFALVFLGTA